ncbi:(2Fe-2S)-binding protein [Streptosporangium sp. NPDC000396]|uniref:(2Fe-2S)-binding protein n=1 Tax=Streptosporangium sp. NPDC000396 TaxID=3366185 RepID=UPI0036C61716
MTDDPADPAAESDNLPTGREPDPRPAHHPGYKPDPRPAHHPGYKPDPRPARHPEHGPGPRPTGHPEHGPDPRPTGHPGHEPGPRPVGSRLVEDALADVSEINAYFELETGPAGPGWRPLTGLLTDAGALPDMISEVAGRLGTTETRVAASILFQGLAARLWSPVVGVAVAHGLLVGLSSAHVFWRPVSTGPLPLRAAGLTGWEITDPGRVAGPLYRSVVTELLEPLARVVQEVVKIAPGLLWDNAASALAGAVGTIARQRPELAGRAITLGRELLSRGVLKGGELAEPAPGRPFFVRRGCCLYYRLPGGGKCGDCALIDPRIRHEQWAQAVRDARETP